MTDDTGSGHVEVAIIGKSCRLPSALNSNQFWDNLMSSRCCLHTLTDDQLKAAGVTSKDFENPDYVKVAGIVGDVDKFDASFFGFTPAEAKIMDPQQRVFMELAWEALENAGYISSAYEGRIGVFAGCGMNSYFNRYVLPATPNKISLSDYEIGILNDKDFLPLRVSYHFGLRGPRVSVNTACSTSLVAVHLGVQSLLNYESDIVVAGGISLRIPEHEGYIYQNGGILSRDGHCRPFDEMSNGTVPSSGAGIVVLKRLHESIEDRDCIHAIIKGSSINNDGGNKVGFSAPGVFGQKTVISDTLAFADIDPDSIQYVETHGTGTPIGDPIEIQTLAEAYQCLSRTSNKLILGSVKSNIGHVDTAAGIAGLIKATEIVKTGLIPATKNFTSANKNLALEDNNLYINDELETWPSNSTPRRVGISSFGIGGTNAHMIIEEPPEPIKSESHRAYQLLTMSAKTVAALEKTENALWEHLGTRNDILLGDAAYTLQVGRRSFLQRKYHVVKRSDRAVQILTSGSGEAREENPTVVFLFPGQGTQHIYMAAEIYKEEQFFKEELDRCADYLRPYLGVDIREIIFPSDANQLDSQDLINQTNYTQPILFSVEYALARLLMNWGIKPDLMIGHSIGEYVAATLSGVFQLDDALKLITARGQLMQSMKPGSMIAVACGEEQLEKYFQKDLSIAAINSPNNCVLSGCTDRINEAIKKLTHEGIRTTKLHTSHAFHSRMAESIIDKFSEVFADISINKVGIPFISNVTGTVHGDQALLDCTYWCNHLLSPVQFSKGIQSIEASYQPFYMEVGPGNTLSTLIQQHSCGVERKIVQTLPHAREDKADNLTLAKAIGKCWIDGVSINWEDYNNESVCQRIELPTYSFERTSYWLDQVGNPKSSDIAPSNATKNTDITQWFYKPTWERSVNRVQKPKIEQDVTLLVFASDDPVSNQLVQRIEQQWDTVIVVTQGNKFEKTSHQHYIVNPQQRSDYTKLINDISMSIAASIKIIHMWGLASTGSLNSFKNFLSGQHAGFLSLTWLLQELEKYHSKTLELYTVCANSQEVLGGEVLYPEKATSLGITLVASQEYPNLMSKFLDMDLSLYKKMLHNTAVDKIVEEFTIKPRGEVMAFRGNHFWTRKYHKVSGIRVEPSTMICANGVYLILGGLGNIGLTIAEFIAETAESAIIVLATRPSTLSQSDSNSRQKSNILAKVEKIRSMGARVILESADLASITDTRQIVERVVKQYGRIHGVFHAAGPSVNDTSCPISGIDSEHYRANYQSKIFTTMALEKALVGIDVEFVLILSSLSSVLGGIGYASYASVNLFQDEFTAKTVSETGVPWLTLNMDKWDFSDDLIGETNKSLANTVYNMNPDEGKQMIKVALSHIENGQLVVSTSCLNTRYETWVVQPDRILHNDVVETVSTNMPASKKTPPTPIESDVLQIWKDVLGLDSIGLEDNFFKLGGHSLLALNIISAINRRFEVDLPNSSIFDAPSVSLLSEMVYSHKSNKSCDKKMVDYAV